MLKNFPILVISLICSRAALSLPIGFGVPQADRVYHQTTNPNFLIYHDAEASQEARLIMDSLESARPILNHWFDIARKGPMPVISSAVTSNASFANFLTGAIELQTLGQGQRDLFWHEYVHMMMFLHLENFMGHAGTIFHIPWMPAWFLEGLAEALSVSVRSERQASIERKQALTHSWPSYDRLHSLYSSSGFFEQGYASSGAFVSWILRKGYAKEANFLPLLLKRFYKYTMPYYYPLSATPITDFLPMDEALRDFLGKKGRELYEEYKAEAEAYWASHRKFRFLDSAQAASKIFYSLPLIKSYHDKIFTLQSHTDTHLAETELSFDPESGFVNIRKATGTLFSRKIFKILDHGDFPIGIETVPALKTGLPIYRIVFLKKNESTYERDSLIVQREGQIGELGESLDKIYWDETVYEVSRLCYIHKSDLNLQKPVEQHQVHCPISETLPRTLEIIGGDYTSRDEKFFGNHAWYAIHEQTLEGDRQELWEWKPDQESFTQIPHDERALPLRIVKLGSSRWMLISERTHRTLVKTGSHGECLGMLTLEEDLVSMTATDEELILGFSVNGGYALRKVHPKTLSLEPCRAASTHISPLLLAMRDPKISLASAIKDASLWKKWDIEKKITAAPMGKATEKTLLSDNKDAEWHPRPILALPWIGANDALGYQLGFVSVPLMDHMQNETVYASVLYGIESRYPNTELSLISTRFWPQLSLSAYRRQLWNGNFRVGGNDIVTSYIDEKGTRLAMNLIAYLPGLNISFTTGLLAARRDPYMGPKTVGSQGTMLEPFGTLAFSGVVHTWSWLLALDGQIAPGEWNPNFDFNVLGSRASLRTRLPFLNSILGFQLEGSRTRGPIQKTPLLKQVYFPLKTFIPGSGSSYTQNSFPLFGNGRLLQANFGDTKARGEANWSFPLVNDWDKLLWIMYFYELRFSSFVNYGGAWYQNENPRSRLMLAHGYSLDMLFENKGVHFNLGLGAGQVKPGPGQIFFNAGFDLLL